MSRLLELDSAEPHPNWRRSLVKTYFLATRPAFFTITAVGVLLGSAYAIWHALRGATEAAPLGAMEMIGVTVGCLLLTLLLALTAHAAANVINDACDEATDRCNRTRLYPFTGGSRFLQNGVLTRTELARFAVTLFLITALGGCALTLWLATVALERAVALAAIGAVGLMVGWAYSVPPLRLSARGLGEIAIAVAWSLVVAGAATVVGTPLAPSLPQEALLSAGAVGLPFGFLVANILYINQFPDAPADAAGNKRTLPVRFGARAAWGYPFLAAVALALHLGLTAAGLLPWLGILALVAFVPAFRASRILFAFVRAHPRWSDTTDFSPLRPAIVATLHAAHGYALLLAAILIGDAVR
ncbi:prenyltransferase [Hydrogenophilus thiooxidans]|uniref:prenyltransferase n=1 Tax=Hydrogenophilus thiooxidans TaxID=2820326 RepID=UPI001C222019|nr:prenyltransferase [Hydrogenophilus thiooxidans]